MSATLARKAPIPTPRVVNPPPTSSSSCQPSSTTPHTPLLDKGRGGTVIGIEWDREGALRRRGQPKGWSGDRKDVVASKRSSEVTFLPSKGENSQKCHGEEEKDGEELLDDVEGKIHQFKSLLLDTYR